MMRTREQIITRIDAFLARTAMTERAFCLSVAGDHKFLRRLRSGAGVTLTLIEKAEEFMASHGATSPGAGDTAGNQALAELQGGEGRAA